MAGEAQTTEFMLGSATLMLGPQAAMFDLMPDVHGLGLVKNIKVKSDVAFKDLTQGVQNKLVFSVKTGTTTTVSAEVYEYTARNKAYALGLDGGVNSVAPSAMTATATATVSAALTVSVVSATGIAAGAWVILADPIFTDRTYLRKVLSVATNVLTLTQALPAVVLPVGTTVTLFAGSDIGSSLAAPFFSAKVIGTTAENKTAGMVFPKVRITSGFEYGFMTDDFSNIPLELTVFDLVPTDPHYQLFSNRQGMLI